MNFFQALVLGILQGLTEFLPVSSSAHLVLVPWILGWPAPGVTFDAVLHLGTVIAILAVFWRDVVRLVVGWFHSVLHPRHTTSDGKLAWLWILSAIPAALLGFLLNDLFESLFGTPRIVAILLIVTGILLWVSETLGKRERTLGDLTWVDALFMGVAQGISIAPGISRSGATIAMGLVCGLKREDAARFAFLMAVPVIVGAAAFKLLDISPAELQVSLLITGLAAASIAGYLVIRVFLGYLRSHSLKSFAIYCAVAGILAFALALVRA